MSKLIQSIENHLINKRPVWRFPSEGLELTLEEMCWRAEQYAAKLQMLGVKSQDKVGLVLHNSTDYAALLIAILKINAIAVPLRPKGSAYTKSDNYLIGCDKVCGFRLIIYGDTADEAVFDGWTDKTCMRALSLDDFKLLPSGTGPVTNVMADRSDVAILQFSSGSTGHPKAVVVTHAMMMAQLDNLVENHTRSRHGRPVASSASWMPINHDMGLFIGVLKPLYVGCDNLLAPPNYYMRNPGRWFSHLSQNTVDFTFTTSSALAITLPAIRQKHQGNDIDLSNLHLYIAAEKVSPVILRRAYEILPLLKMARENIHIGYGMAENTLGCACTRSPMISIKRFLIRDGLDIVPVAQDDPNPESVELVSVGTPDNRHKITIRDPHDRILAPLHLGEINIESPCISPGYFNNQEASEKSFIHGRFRSGDLGFFFENELYFYGRRDDTIVVGGRNLVPDDIEGLAEELPFVRPTSTCLISMENPNKGTEELVLLVEVSRMTTGDALKRYAMSTQEYVYSRAEVLISHVIFCAKGTIEKTSSGKKRRKVIRNRLVRNEVKLVETFHGE